MGGQVGCLLAGGKALRGRNGDGPGLFWMSVIAAVLLAIAYLRYLIVLNSLYPLDLVLGMVYAGLEGEFGKKSVIVFYP